MRAESAASDDPGDLREVRLGLVLNGGVSLAIWIGGVVREIDNLRRAADADADKAHGTRRLYRSLVHALQERVVVDVIAGASAGGINGIVLGAAIFAGKPLPDLRETWIGLGDFRTLLRSPSESNPPSLLRGDEVVLTKLQSVLGEVMQGADGTDCSQRHLNLYVTATDLYGFTRRYRDSTDRSFDERDFRRTFTFVYEKPGEGETESDRTLPLKPDHLHVMRRSVDFRHPDAAELLARAARSTSSFPVAFEPHRLKLPVERLEAEEAATLEASASAPDVDWHWMIDGGVLDNQPFNPVLDQIAVLPPEERPVRRVVAYVVPYVNERGSLDKPAPEETSALTSYGASGGLPRALAKLQSLDRVTADWAQQRVAQDDSSRAWTVLRDGRLKQAAEALFDAYVRTRARAAERLFRQWADPAFRPGSGVLAQDPTIDPRSLAPPEVTVTGASRDEPRPAEPWLPERPNWDRSDEAWEWGFAAAERAAAWALLAARQRDGHAMSSDALRTRLTAMTRSAGDLIWEVRSSKQLLYDAFDAGHGDVVLGRAHTAFVSIRGVLENLQERFRGLDTAIADVNAALPADDALPRVQDLLHMEIVRNAFSVGDPRVPFPFEFLFVSAGVSNSLGHKAEKPIEKLAGMKLAHFAGFLKRSWRANDWLWGRLDGVEHVLQAALDIDRLDQLGPRPAVVDALTGLAFLSDEPDHHEERRVVEEAWKQSLARDRAPSEDRRPVLEEAESSLDVQAQFGALLVKAGDASSDRRYRERCLCCCRAALAARIQLQILEDDLQRVAETAADDVDAGASRLAGGLRWASRFFDRGADLRRTDARELGAAERVALFKELDIGTEDPGDEASSRLALDLAAQGTAVGAALVAGSRGGLPPPVRATLATLRGVTLALSSLVRLLALTPIIGAALIFVLSALLVWGIVSPGLLLGTLVPLLAILVVVGGIAILTIATGTLERSPSNAKRIIAFLVLLLAPLGYSAYVFLSADWLDDKVGAWATGVSAFLGLGAFVTLGGVGIFHALPGWPRRWIRTLLNAYRVCVAGALGVLAVGFISQQWIDAYSVEDSCRSDDCRALDWERVADEQRGIILVGLMILVFLVSAAIVELVAPWFQRRALAKRDQARPSSKAPPD